MISRIFPKFKSEAQARYHARMAGLPVALIGIQLLLLSLVFLPSKGYSYIIAVVLFSVTLIGVGVYLRSNLNYWMAIFALGISVLLCSLVVIRSFSAGEIPFSSLILIVCVVLGINGVRATRWLRGI